MSKSCKLQFSFSSTISPTPLRKIHCDLWRPAPAHSNQGYRFYIIFFNDLSCYVWWFPLRHKSGFYDCFKIFQKFVEKQVDKKIKIFQSDGGREFSSRAFKNHLENDGIRHQISFLDTTEQSSVAERKHRHIVEL